ncbi:MAG TPA: M1 family aminopeptidase [Polyangiaceae bacterium]|nr:M1 family aminopeptidase [Polyangiaceae bacterium]
MKTKGPFKGQRSWRFGGSAVASALLSAGLVASCSGEASAGPRAGVRNEIAAGPRAGVRGEARSAAAHAARGGRPAAAAIASGLDVERYDLVGDFDWSQGRLHASVTVTLSAAHAPPSTVVLDSGVAVREVRLASGAALPFSADAAAKTLSIELGAHAAPGAALVIDYDAATPHAIFGDTALNVFNPRPGDPDPSRLMYTFSEPEQARDWLPSHDDPADRAFFSVDLHVGAGERLVANGDLVDDSTGGGCVEGRMKYATAYTLPTYLMAFSLGEFEVEEKQGPHGLPLSVWHRPGVRGDFKGTLDELARLVRTLEGLTGVAYPFEKYALVLVPDMGGEEHASISFQDENGSAHPDLGGDLALTTHELAHQWFGDLVTVASWDELWIKEGMATLLEYEGTRTHLDRDGVGLFGMDARFILSGQPVRDTSTPPQAKYHTGSYDRAGWVFAQLRALVGEAAFWGGLRQVLNDHRFGAVDREGLLAPFRAALGEEGLAKVRRATDAYELPALTVESLAVGARVTFDDPEGALFAPMSVAWHRADGSVETVDIAPGVPTDLVPSSPDDLLVIDPLDIHPAWSLFMVDPASFDAYFSSVEPWRTPATPAQRARFLEVGGGHQEGALIEGGALPAMAPQEFAGFLGALDSDDARAVAVQHACGLAASEGGGWVEAARRALRHRRAFTFGIDFVGYDACADVLPAAELFSDNWPKLLTGLDEPLLDEVEITYLSKFSAGSPAENLSIWSAVFEQGYSGRVRRTASNALSTFAFSLPPGEHPAWRAKTAALLASTGMLETAFPLIFIQRRIAGPTAADNAAGLDAFTTVLHRASLHFAHQLTVCRARSLVKGDEAAWAAFVASVADAELSPDVRAALESPPPGCL